jgi:hypothetical protein
MQKQRFSWPSLPRYHRTGGSCVAEVFGVLGVERLQFSGMAAKGNIAV